MLPRTLHQRDQDRLDLPGVFHPLLLPSDSNLCTVQLALLGRVRQPRDEAGLRSGLTAAEGTVLDKALGRGPGPGELWLQHLQAKHSLKGEADEMLVSPLLEFLLQGGSWRKEVLSTACEAYKELRSLDLTAEMARRHVNSWILFEFVGLWRCMKYRHPAASARVPGKPRFAWAGPQVIDMSVQQVFEQTIKDKRDWASEKAVGERVLNIRRKLITSLMPDDLYLAPVPVQLHSVQELAVYLKLMAEHYKLPAKEKTRVISKSSGSIAGSPTKAMSLHSNDMDRWRRGSAAGAVILIEHVHPRTSAAGSLQLGHSVCAEDLLPLLDMPARGGTKTTPASSLLPPPAAGQLIKHVTASKQGSGTIWVPPDEDCIMAAMRTIQLASDAVARDTMDQFYVQVTPVPAAAVSTDTDSEGVMASAQAKHALALVLTRVKQLPVRTVPARFNAQLQALAERLGGEWWPHQLELVKQWWGKHWTGLLLANATCKAADSSKGPVDTDFITVFRRDFCMHIWPYVHDTLEISWVMGGASNQRERGHYDDDDDDDDPSSELFGDIDEYLIPQFKS